MSAPISYTVNFPGLDQSIVKWAALNKEINAVARNVGTIGGNGPGGLGGVGKGGTTIIPTGGALEGAAAGAAAGSLRSGKLDEEMKNLLLLNQQQMFNIKKGAQPFSGPASEQLKKFLLEQQQKLFGGSNGVGLEGLRGKIASEVGLGEIGKMFKAGGFSGIGKLIGSFSALGVIAGVLVASFFILKKVIGELVEGIKAGTEAYRNAAKMGRSVSSEFQLQSAFKALGLEGMDTSELQGQFNPKSRKFNIPGTDEVLGAARIGQLGNAQQLLNMSEEFRHAMADGASSAVQMAGAAKSTQQLSEVSTALGREWKTLWAQLAAILTPIIGGFEVLLEYIMKFVNAILEMIVNLGKMLHWIPQETTFEKIGGSAGKGGTSSYNSWEKMGFVMDGNSPTQNIEKNTRDTVTAIKDLGKILQNKITSQTSMGTYPNPFSLSLP